MFNIASLDHIIAATNLQRSHYSKVNYKPWIMLAGYRQIDIGGSGSVGSCTSATRILQESGAANSNQINEMIP